MSLRVVTWNVWGLPLGLAPELGRRTTAISDLMPSLEADAVAFQEVWTEETFAALVEGATRAGMPHHYPGRAEAERGGLLVVARHPIGAASFRSFRLRGHAERLDHADYWGGKGFLRVELETASTSVVLYTTHLHAAYAERESDRYRPYRTGQIVELASAIGAETLPTVVAGDLNCEEASLEFRLLATLTGLRDAAAELDGRQPTIGADSITHPDTRRIDYVLFRDGREIGVEPTAVRTGPEASELGELSDHAAVAADIAWSSEPSPAPVPDPALVTEARRMLGAGALFANRRRHGLRAAATLGVFGAGATGAIGWKVRQSRRRALGGLLMGVGALGLLPAGLGALTLASTTEPDQINAFREVALLLGPAPAESAE